MACTFSRQGSVVVESVAEYNYPNNNSQITFLNTNLSLTLEKIFNDSDSLKNLSAALGDVPIEGGQIDMETPEVSGKLLFYFKNR